MPRPRRIVSRAELARIKGVSRAAVTQLLQRNPKAGDGDRVDIDYPAIRIWLGDRWPHSDHAPPLPPKQPPVPAARPTRVVRTAPIARSDPTAPRPSEPIAPPQEAAPEPDPVRAAPPPPPPVLPPPPPRSPEASIPHPDGPGSDVDLEKIADVIRPLLNRFGTERAFRDWLLALKEIETIREKRISNEEAEGDLIPRDLVKTHIFGVLEQQNKRLLGDTPKTIARRAHALANSGAGIEVTEAMVRESISSQLAPVKARVVKVLRDA